MSSPIAVYYNRGIGTTFSKKGIGGGGGDVLYLLKADDWCRALCLLLLLSIRKCSGYLFHLGMFVSFPFQQPAVSGWVVALTNGDLG